MPSARCPVVLLACVLMTVVEVRLLWREPLRLIAKAIAPQRRSAARMGAGQLRDGCVGSRRPSKLGEANDT
jgi:hypothetical protein